MDSSVLQLASMAVTLGVAAVFDIRQRRVPNWLTYGATLAGLGWHVLAGTPGTALVGMLACGAVGVLLYVLSRLGAGDAKLLIAIGAWLGVGLGLDVALLTLFGGAAVGLVLLLVRGVLPAMIRELWLTALTLTTPGARPMLPKQDLSFPLAPVMALAFAVVAFLPNLRPLSPFVEVLR